MNRFLAVVGLIVAAPGLYAQSAALEVAIGSHVAQENARIVLVEIRSTSNPTVDEIRLELPRKDADTAILQMGPKDWTLKRNGHAVMVSGPGADAPLRIKIILFDLLPLDQIRVQVGFHGRDLFNAIVSSTELPPFKTAASIDGFVEPPAVMEPGDTVEMKVLDPKTTPSTGQWIIGGAPAIASGPDSIRVELPQDLPPAEPLRISYFNNWGERIVDALSVPGSTITERSTTSGDTPRITGCARAAFIGQSLCVCGVFPESARNGIRLDGQPASVISSSRNAIRIALPQTLAPGPHIVSGDPSAGFNAGDSTTFLALLLTGSIDVNALFRGQETTMRLSVKGTNSPVIIIVVNHSSGVVSISGGNYQEITTSGGENNTAERRVDAIARGNFSITYGMDAARCPCEQNPSRISTASQINPIYVPRRILAIVTLDTPAAMYAIAQAVALAHGMAVIEIDPMAITGEGLAIFEILDGLNPINKAIELGADPRVTLAQPDFVYDTSQGSQGTSDLFYGPRMIGADLAEKYSQGNGINIGVIDTGIDTGIPGLRGKVTGYSDVTGTGWTPDAHGSLVAGIIAADNNPSGPMGVAPGAKLIGVKSCVAQSVSSAAASCWSSTLARGIDLASQKSIRVLNLSIGGPEDKLLSHMVDAVIRKGIVVVSAAGNDGPEGKPSYPAALKGVAAVTAVDAAMHLYPQATRGNYVSLAAPGVDILSTGPGGRTQVFSGTSAAAAFTAGSVALLLQQRPTLSPEGIQDLLRQTARPLGTKSPDPEFGYGLLNLCRAIAKLTNRQIACN